MYFWKVDEPQTSWLESSFDITAVKTEDIDDNDDSGEQYPEDGEYLESGGIAEEGQYFDEDTGWLKNLDLCTPISIILKRFCIHCIHQQLQW